jgi:hypothetical protein
VGYWLLAGMILTCLPRYRQTLGVWTVIVLGYVFAVYLISVENTHYFAPVWSVLFVILAVPGDFLLARLFSRPEVAGTSAK